MVGKERRVEHADFETHRASFRYIVVANFVLFLFCFCFFFLSSFVFFHLLCLWIFIY